MAAQVDEGAAPATVCNRIALLAGLWTAVASEGMHEGASPFKGLATAARRDDKAPVEKRQGLPREIWEKLGRDLWDAKCWLGFAIWATGARRDEICGLEPDDIDPETGFIQIRRNESRGLKTKSSPRLLWVEPECAKGLLAVSGKRRLGLGGKRSRLERQLNRVSTEKCSPHMLRHSMADRLREAGADKRVSDFLLGQLVGDTSGDLYGSVLTPKDRKSWLLKVRASTPDASS
jgi:integrase